ncbi:hypothetical protein KGQ31_02205 [Patescibacteria group bacterium]|nr:hypothetical protein [Patescibacteria group bacterium]
MQGFILPFIAILSGAIALVSLKRGPIFLPTRDRALRSAIGRLRIISGERAIDLGSGNGKVVIALARAGAVAHGYEHNPFLIWWSRRAIRKAGLADRAFIHRGNFWNCDLSGFSAVTIFGVPYIMARLERKLEREARAGTRLASYLFALPRRAPVFKENGVFFYKF